MAGAGDIANDVYDAIHAVADGDEDRLYAAVERLERSDDVVEVLKAVDIFAEMLRASNAPDLTGSVERRTRQLAPEDPTQRELFNAFARALFIDGDAERVVSILKRLGMKSDGAGGDAILASIFVAGRVARDLGTKFEWSDNALSATDRAGQASSAPVAAVAPPMPTAAPRAAPRPASSSSAPSRRRPPRRRRSVFSILLTVVGLVTIPWAIYANQDAQRLRCLAYKISGVSRPLPWTVTCFLNGNS